MTKYEKLTKIVNPQTVDGTHACAAVAACLLWAAPDKKITIPEKDMPDEWWLTHQIIISQEETGDTTVWMEPKVSSRSLN